MHSFLLEVKMAVYGPSTGHYSAASIKAARAADAAKNTNTNTGTKKTTTTGTLGTVKAATTPTTNTKTIADYKSDYSKAYAVGDLAGMRAANDGANAIRTSLGQATYSSAVGDAQRAANYSPYELKTTINGTETTQETSNSPYDTDIQDKISALSDAKKQSQMDALAKARNNALSSLDSRKSTIEPYYYNKRNQAAAQNDVGAMNFAQYMASRGVQGNAAAMPEMYRNAALQSQLGNLNTQEVSDLSAIESDRSNIESNYQADIAAAAQDAEATKLQNYISQLNLDRNYNADQANTAQKNFDNTIYAYSGNYKAEIDKLQALINSGQKYDTDGVSLQYKINALNAARNQKLADQQTAAAAQQQQDFENEMKLKQIEYQTGKPYFKPTSSSSGKKYSTSQIEYALDNGWIDDATAQALLGF